MYERSKAICWAIMIRRWFPPIFSVCFVMAGSFKAASFLQGLPIDLTLAFALLTGGAVAWTLISTRSLPRAAISIMIGFAILLPTVLWAPATVYARTKMVDFFTLTLLAGIAPAMLITSRKDVERWIAVLAAMCAVHAFGSFVNPVQDYAGGPVSSFANNTITLGVTSSTVIIVMTVALVWRRIRWWIAVPVMGAMMLSLLNSGSRGPLFGVVIALAIAIFLAPGRVRFSTAVVGAGLIGAGVIYAYRFAPIYAQARIADVLSGRLDTSSGARLILYGAAARSIVAHPLGLGMGGFAGISPFPELPYPHDIVLEVLSEAGVFIGTAFLCWLGVQVVRTWRGATSYAGATVFALVVFSLFIALVSGDVRDNVNLFFFLGISAALWWKAPRLVDGEPSAREASHGTHDVVREQRIARALS